MQKEAKLTLTGLIVTIVVILFVFLLLHLALDQVRKIAFHVVCGTNLKGLGTAMMVYGNDYNDNYPQLSGNGLWSKELGFPYFLERPDFTTAQSNTLRTISASLYLLVKEADVSPRSFVCPWANQKEFDGRNPNNLDIVELWDFGYDPHDHVSYTYHNPYGKFPADGNQSPAFGLMADMSPWFQKGSFVIPGKETLPPQVINIKNKSTWNLGNTLNHELKESNPPRGQNVLFVDGHISGENQSNVGVQNDNIYTFWSVEENPTEQDRQGGTAPTGRSAENDAKSKDDSFLAI